MARHLKTKKDETCGPLDEIVRSAHPIARTRNPPTAALTNNQNRLTFKDAGELSQLRVPIARSIRETLGT